ncbi:MAG: cytochrome c oxidase subunit II [Nitrospirae bacterium]|nr:cytochrome c oxidase subunit II [Nitrospirota bacterium]
MTNIKYLLRIMVVISAVVLAFAWVHIARLAAETQTVQNPVANQGHEQVIKITVKRFDYTPNKIRLKKGVAVTLVFTSLDRTHGFNCPGLGVRTDIVPGKSNTLRIVPQKAGRYEFSCDVFCGDGHEDMSGEIIVED